MRIKEWIAENIGYRFFGCFYNRSHDPIFAFIQSKIPKKFLHRNITDLGCGDGANTVGEAVKNFRYIFLCEPILDLYHRLFDGGTPLLKQEWIDLFDRVLKTYNLYQHKNNLIVFYKKGVK